MTTTKIIKSNQTRELKEEQRQKLKYYMYIFYAGIVWLKSSSSLKIQSSHTRIDFIRFQSNCDFFCLGVCLIPYDIFKEIA